MTLLTDGVSGPYSAKLPWRYHGCSAGGRPAPCSGQAGRPPDRNNLELVVCGASCCARLACALPLLRPARRLLFPDAGKALTVSNSKYVAVGSTQRAQARTRKRTACVATCSDIANTAFMLVGLCTTLACTGLAWPALTGWHVALCYAISVRRYHRNIRLRRQHSM